MSIEISTVLDALRGVVDPDLGKDVIRLNMIRGLRVEEERIGFTIVLKDPAAPFARTVAEACKAAIHRALGADVPLEIDLDNEMIGLGVDLQVQGGKPAPPDLGVTNTIAVASGKGGVGKSTVAANLAVGLAQQGYAVGLVDADIYGPSIPTMFGVASARPSVNAERKIIPIEQYGVKLLSMGFLVDPEKAVIWRGPMVTSAIRQFLGEAEWGGLDYLVLDLPPGTGDIQLTIVQSIALTAAVIVSTPQEVALADARKGVAMFEQVQVPVLGIIENMAYFTPPDLPDRKYYLFGEGGARRLADTLDVPFLGEVPLEQPVREAGDQGKPILLAAPESLSGQAFRALAARTAAQVDLRNATAPPTSQIEILHR